MWTAHDYLGQVKPRLYKYTALHIASVWRYHNTNPRGTYVDLYC